MKAVIFLISFALLSCKDTPEKFEKFVKCVEEQIGKPFEYGAMGPDKFCNQGLVWYCRDVAEMEKISTIYVSWKDVKYPKKGSVLYGIISEDGHAVNADCLGVINEESAPLYVGGVSGENIAVKQLVDTSKYLYMQYIYLDF